MRPDSPTFGAVPGTCDKDPDAALVRASANGDRVAFETLLQHYEKPIYNVAMRMLQQTEDARDVVQIVFLKAFEKLHQFDYEHRFYSWIYRIAINESLDILNRRSRLAPLGDDEEGADEDSNPQDACRTAQLGAGVQAAMTHLAPDYRAVIVLRHFVDCSYQEMAEILGVEVKTVKSRLFTARQLLRERLATDGVDEA
jgi:RNA polymerase sigma-70 factor, ECF subfamily